ncbi:MAG TPA: DUF1127 domain-containing protein [Xanthobacteraceae bacterium]|jgi:uncharacterized protein YjiS (DUF1127 family)
MRGSDDFYFLRFEHRPLTPEQLDYLVRCAERAAREYRTRSLRSLCVAVLTLLRSAASGVRGVVRPLGNRAAAAASERWSAYAAWRTRRAAVRELAALDDRTLKDLGLTRSEIESVVYRQDATRVRERAIAVARRCPPAARPGTAISRRSPPSMAQDAA